MQLKPKNKIIVINTPLIMSQPHFWKSVRMTLLKFQNSIWGVKTPRIGKAIKM
jgi:hypothetical protein